MLEFKDAHLIGRTLAIQIQEFVILNWNETIVWVICKQIYKPLWMPEERGVVLIFLPLREDLDSNSFRTKMHKVVIVGGTDYQKHQTKQNCYIHKLFFFFPKGRKWLVPVPLNGWSGYCLVTWWYFSYSMETALTSILPNPEYFLGHNPELCLSVNRTNPY